jgi:hypothetical protein
MPRLFVMRVLTFLRHVCSGSILGAFSADRLVYHDRTRKAAITLVMAAVLGVGGLALSVDLRTQLMAASEGQSAFALDLILALRGL